MSNKLDKIWHFEQFDLLKEIPRDLLLQFDDDSALHNSYKKEAIYLQGSPSDYIYFLKKGRVKITKGTEDGKETTLYVVNPGEIFGELSLVDAGERTHQAEALDEEVMVCSFEKKKFLDIINNHPQLARQVYKRIGERLQLIEKKLSDLIFMSSEDRILSFLLEVGEPHLRAEVDEAFIKPFFTHEEIAHLTATSRQTVTTVLNELKKEGIITFGRNKMYIREYSALKKKFIKK
ncbi:Crp/Fnr family transcriptional regulator [bacterium]|nr:MAG: Crp/Fnr family transcriptional regulator [bacterium]